MQRQREDVAQRRDRRRRRAASAPARVLVPTLLASAVEAAAIAVTLAVGASTLVVVLVAVAVAAATSVAAHRTVGSLLAGAGLRVARPYDPGEHVRLFVPSLQAVTDAEVVRVGAANTTLLTERGLVVVPNAQMLRGTPEYAAD